MGLTVNISKTPKKRMEFSKVLALLILLGDLALSAGTLYLCYLAINLCYTGELGYLVTLIGLYQVATGYVLGQYFSKSKAENTSGGIKYDSVMHSIKGNSEEKIEGF